MVNPRAEARDYYCELVRRELEYEDRLLIPIGKYLRGEIDLGCLLEAQRILRCENDAKHC